MFQPLPQNANTKCSAATVGCVLKVDRDTLCVLDQNGSIRSVKPSQISNLIDQRRIPVATDRNGSEIRVRDKVREIGGEQKQGTIKHIHRSFLFLHNQAQNDNSGISVVRANNVATIAARGARVGQGTSNGLDLARMNPALHNNGANGTGKNMGPPNAANRWDRAYGQRCIVRRGPNKGLLGFLVSHRDEVAFLELDGSARVLEVPKDHLGFGKYGQPPCTERNCKLTLISRMSEQTREYLPFERTTFGRGRGRVDTAGPPKVPDWSGGRTPSGAAQGGRTPAWGASSRSRP